MCFPGTAVKQTGLYLPELPFLPFWKITSTFATHLLVVVISGTSKQLGVAIHITSNIKLNIKQVNIPNFLLGQPTELVIRDKLHVCLFKSLSDYMSWSELITSSWKVT